jgi:MoxR-like ATPase
VPSKKLANKFIKDMNQAVDIKELNERIQRESSFVDMISMEMNKVIVGQKHLVESLLIGLLSNGIGKNACH